MREKQKKMDKEINLKGKKGITLIALVITIIVLLILVGVTIATLTGDNGLLTKTEKAKNTTKKAKYIEILSLITMQTKNIDEIKIEIEKNENIKVSEYKEYYENLVVITEDNYKFLINNKKVLAVELLNIEYGNIEIYPDYYILNNEIILADEDNYFIIGSTNQNSVKILGNSSNTYNIYINDLTIDVRTISNLSAFNIIEGANVNLNLLGVNSFESGDQCAGLQKSSKDGYLTINGTGALTAKGNTHSAGIGGGSASSVASCTNIVINNGTITACSGNLGSGIGAGHAGSAVVDNIQINGGTVFAEGSDAAIGTGRKGTSVSNIKITGGKVTARSWWEGNAIGGHDLSNVEITGGTLEAYTYANSSLPAIGTRNESMVEGIRITGGNVYLHSRGSIIIGTSSTAVAPINENGGEVFETVLTLNNINKEILITNIEFIDYSGTYGLKDMTTWSNGKVYLYLPAGVKVKSITAGDLIYTSETPIEAGTSGILNK